MDKYEKNESCLNFTLQELKENLFDLIEKRYKISAKYDFCERLISPTDVIGKFQCVTFDYNGEENVTIQFFNESMIGFFVCDEAIMFIDDIAKQNIRGLEGCIFYEGTLRDKTHKQILHLFFELFSILYGTKFIEYEECLIKKFGFYRVNDYTVKINKLGIDKSRTIQFDNITFDIR